VFEDWVRRDVGEVYVQMIDLIPSPQQTEFGPAKRDTLLKSCLQCDVRFACHGGCSKDRFATTHAR
jgi:uncharacterized protein